MQDGQRVRKIGDLIEDFDGLRARCEALGDRLKGLALLFGCASALVLAVGAWGRAPLFAVSAGFGFAAALAFAAAAHTAAQAARAAPRVQPSFVPVRIQPRRRAA